MIETAPGRADIEVLCRIERQVHATPQGLSVSAAKRPVALRLDGAAVTVLEAECGPGDHAAIAAAFGTDS
ncbi:MAG TPA: hypothetical protein DDY29_06710 [Rhodobacteraceae bacterium]|jgi:hypothetical protein|nr:hypothetical protein [Paracoccaceae bacterium]